MSKKNSFFYTNEGQSHFSTCCVCRRNLDGSSTVVSSNDRDFVFLTRNIWIPEGARCCPDHIILHRFTQQALDSVKPLSIRYQEWNSSDLEMLLERLRILHNSKKRFNFDDSRDLSDDAYFTLTSLSKDAFDHLVEEVSSSNVKNSCHRSVRTAVGIYLCKIRLGLSNRLLTIMFELPDKRIVSRIINSARQALMESFVPYNLGFNHITRQEIIDLHTTTIARELMCDGGEDTAIVVVDGTYIYIQVRKHLSALFPIIFFAF